MGNRNIKKETKKPKKSDKDSANAVSHTTPGMVAAPPVLIERTKKTK